MSIAVKSEAHHQLMYANNVQMVAQQTRRTLRDAVTEVPCSGEAHAVTDLVGAVNAIRGDGRDRRNIENVPLNSRRWVVFPPELQSGQYVDKAEKLQRAMDPTSSYVRNHTVAVQREIADVIMGVERQPNNTYKVTTGGILGAASDGKAPGANKVALPAQNIIAAGGTGLTLAKLKQAKEKLALREFGMDDDEEMYCAISPKQVTDLLDLADGDGASLNAFQQNQLMNGVPTSLLGIKWIRTNRLPIDSNGNRMCPVWSPRNIVLGIWQDVQGMMFNDTHAKNTPYVHVSAYVDAVRVEDGGVEVITCVE